MWYVTWHTGTVLSGFPQPITILPTFHIHSSVIRGMDNRPLGSVVPKRIFVPPQDTHTMAHLSLSVLLVLGSCTYTKSHLNCGCACDPEDGDSTFLRNAVTNQTHTNGVKIQNTTPIQTEDIINLKTNPTQLVT
jgi:hypothetical protein